MDTDSVEVLLDMIVSKLENRKKLFTIYDVRNIDEYNTKMGMELSRILFACDECAELLDKTGRSKEDKEQITRIEGRLSTIARQGRAFGVHLILATQRPDANVIPGQVKNNMDYRVCGRADSVLSQIILDSTAASDEIPKDAQGRFINHEGTVLQGFWFDVEAEFESEGGLSQ